MKKITLLLTLIIIYITSTSQLFAQGVENVEKVEMADLFRQEGKIYVVVAIIAIVLAGMLFYTIRIDRKIDQLEDEFKRKVQ